ncbi:DUF6480 family protein [Crossiella sp. CA-258035]|uniref:DUF6480 family protein n=1 Tax=Crossiella sp. CA-258035 TaxID=2981138 RepID=UPI0024BC2BAC|nr:DUF6480 family protein [Crossiella sp. CA-258035]WHT15963.1 DUF6480 family protein [Crossiella sp. CA-258035]
MSERPPHPEPERTPGLEPGGGVPPGETPPAEGGMSGLSHREPEPSAVTGRVTLVLVGVVTLLVVAMIVAQIVGLIDVL